MRKIKKATTKRKVYSKTDYLFTKDNISIDDKKNKKYLDNIVYQKYLKDESCDLNEE